MAGTLTIIDYRGWTIHHDNNDPEDFFYWIELQDDAYEDFVTLDEAKAFVDEAERDRKDYHRGYQA